MSPIPPPPKINPSALALGNAVVDAKKAEELKLNEIKRGEPVPAGFKRQYAPNRPHQGSKEMRRRQRQMEKAK